MNATPETQFLRAALCKVTKPHFRFVRESGCWLCVHGLGVGTGTTPGEAWCDWESERALARQMDELRTTRAQIASLLPGSHPASD